MEQVRQDLFYRTGRRMMAVEITTQPEFTTGRAACSSKASFTTTSCPAVLDDVAADGRFVMVGLPDPATSPRQINVRIHPAY